MLPTVKTQVDASQPAETQQKQGCQREAVGNRQHRVHFPKLEFDDQPGGTPD